MSKDKIKYLDLIRTLAIFFVIVIHVCTNPAYSFNQLPASQWWFTIVLDSLSRFAVPSFLMITGLLLLDPNKNDDLLTFFKKRFTKVFIPLILWTIIYSAKISLETGKSLSSLLISSVSKPVYFHLWYLYSLTGLYLVIPFLRLGLKNIPKKLIEIYLIFWFIGSTIYPLSDKFLRLPVAINNQYFTGFIGYLVLGFYLSLYQIQKRLIYFLSGLGLLTTIFGTYFLTRQNSGTLDEFFFDPVAPNIILYSLGVFLFLKNHYTNNLIIKTISQCSLGIYLIHPLIIEAFPLALNEFIRIPLTSLFVLVVSLSLVLIIKKIPLLKHLAP